MYIKNSILLIIIIFVTLIIGVSGFLVVNNRSNAIVTTSDAEEKWQSVDANFFTLSLPPGWRLNTLQGIDSYIGELVGDGMTLRFDYGRYSNSLADDGDASYIITYETIGNYNAKLVKPINGESGITGVYFKYLGSDKMNRLQISGENLTESQQEVAFTIFRTVLFLEVAPELVTTIEEEEELNQPAVKAEAPRDSSLVVNCDHDISCFINAVSSKTNGYYWGEMTTETFPGISTWSSQIWDFRLSKDLTSYTFTTKTGEVKVLFVDGWFDELVAAGLISTEAKQSIDNAHVLTESELNLLNSEERSAYEAQIAAGKTPKEIAIDQAIFLMEEGIQSMVAGSMEVGSTKVCTSSDFSSLVALLNNWKRQVYTTNNLDFATCTTRY